MYWCVLLLCVLRASCGSKTGVWCQGGGGGWVFSMYVVHGRCSVKLVLGTGGVIPCHEGVRHWSV